MDLDLLKLFYNYDAKRSSNVEASEVVKVEILKIVTDNHMAPLYAQSCSKYSWHVDSELLTTMEAKNASDLAAIETKFQEATVNAGEMEVLDALFAKARHFAKIGSSASAYEAFDVIIAKEKISTGKKIDATVEKAKVALFNCDNTKLKDIVGAAKKLVEVGGDWDRRNRLKVYEAHFLMANKDLRGASKLLLDCVATFTANELCTYKTFMSYVILTNMLFLDRNDMKKKLVNDPHVITIIRELPNLQLLLNSLYKCDYKSFFHTLLVVHDEALEDPFLGPLCTFIVRELRVLAYSQFLQSYKSVQFSSMAATFNMTPKLLDAELSRFIAAGRINAKIDKVGDIIETKRPDKKNFQYQEVIKKGDALLNQIQKLVRVVDV